jgi:hypothetical protein
MPENILHLSPERARQPREGDTFRRGHLFARITDTTPELIRWDFYINDVWVLTEEAPRQRWPRIVGLTFAKGCVFTPAADRPLEAISA